MKELIEKYQKRIDGLQEALNEVSATPKDIGRIVEKMDFYKDVIRDLESLQPKGKTKEELMKKFSEWFGSPVLERQVFDWFWNNLRESHANKDGYTWIKFDSGLIETYPKKYDKYLICRKDGKIHWETWNGSGWAYNHNEIRYYAQITPPQI